MAGQAVTNAAEISVIGGILGELYVDIQSAVYYCLESADQELLSQQLMQLMKSVHDSVYKLVCESAHDD